MRLLACWTSAALTAVLVLAGAASAEVTVARSNDPTALISSQFASLFGAEQKTFQATPEAQLTALAIGPQAPAAEGKAPEGQIEYTDGFLASLPAPSGGADWDCLRKAIYFEARGEGIRGEFAVAEVVLNRVDSPLFPKTVCGVVEQSGHGACAFSWTCDGYSDTMRDPVSADRAGRIAWLMLQPGTPRLLTDGATYFHIRRVRPDWSNEVVQTVAIGSHVFFRQP
jgi:spore germination cell wall hydrolase CwlJ-like protein